MTVQIEKPKCTSDTNLGKTKQNIWSSHKITRKRHLVHTLLTRSISKRC